MDFWNICKKFWVIDDSEEYWKELISSLDAFVKKYNYDFFAKKLALSFSDYLDYKNENKE